MSKQSKALIERISPLIGYGALGLGLIILWINRYNIIVWFFRNPPDTWLGLIAPKVQDFMTLTTSILVEAFPFLIFGVLVAIIVRRYLKPEWIIKRLPHNVFLRRLLLSVSGSVMPVCECGNVPVARSLMQKGLSPADTLCFLFAAPIINPITIVSTVIAFSMFPSMVWWRIGGALLIAQVAAIVAARFKTNDILTGDFAATCEHSHDNRESWHGSLAFFGSETWTLLKMLVLGAAIAAATQVFIPREIISTVGSDPVLSVLAMIALGVVVSICSSVDAFFALAYVRDFTLGSLVSFLVAGPMIDIKMIALLRTTFRTRFLMIISSVVFGLALLIGLGINIHAA